MGDLRLISCRLFKASVTTSMIGFASAKDVAQPCRASLYGSTSAAQRRFFQSSWPFLVSKSISSKILNISLP